MLITLIRMCITGSESCGEEEQSKVAGFLYGGVSSLSVDLGFQSVPGSI